MAQLLASPHEPIDRRTRTRIFLAAGVIVIAALASYANSLSGAFVFDDRTVTTGNPSIRALWPLSTALSPPPAAGTGGRPFANLTFALNYAMSGTAVGSYHALNLALHALSGLTLFAFVRRLLARAPLQARFGRDALGLALATTLVWMLKPLQTQTVTYVSQRTEGLAGLCFLFTLYAFVRAADSRSPAWSGAAIGACTLGMASKEIVVTAPLLVLLLDRTFFSGSFRAALMQRRAFYGGLAATWLLLAYLMLSSRIGARGVGYDLGVDAWDFMRTQCHALTLYLSLAAWPNPLIFDRGVEVLHRFADAAPYAAVLALLLAATVITLRRRPALGLAGAWFFIIVAPTSSVVPIVLAPIAENRAYLPSAAVAALLVLGSYAAVGRRGGPAVLVAVLALGALTVQRNACYHSETSLWRDTVAKCPLNARANYNLGRALEVAGQFDGAAHYYVETLRLNPTHAKASNNLGNMFVKQGRPTDAIGHYERALQLDPNFAEARINLGTTLAQLGRLPEALTHLERVTQTAPDSVEAHFRYASALVTAGRHREAQGHFEQALRLDPNLPEAHSNLSHALLAVGDPAQAITQAEQALRLRPDYADAHHNLGAALQRVGRWSEAKSQFEELLRLQPANATAHNALGVTLAQLGQTVDAIAHFQEAVRLDPSFAPARENLAQLTKANAK